MKRTIQFWIIPSILLFYISWGVPQLLSQKMGNSILPDLIFSTIFTGIAGCLIPIIIKNKFNLTYNQARSRKILGFVILIFTILFSTVFSEAIFQVIELNYSSLMIIKYIFLFLPMSLAISLFAFHLIPNTIDQLNIKAKGLVTVFAIAVFFFFGFLVDTVFGELELASIMGFLGLMFGLSYIFLRNFFIVYIGFFITMLINTLAENKYDEHLVWLVILSTTISFSIIGYDYLKNRKV
jgi:hypothetical protein